MITTLSNPTKFRLVKLWLEVIAAFCAGEVAWQAGLNMRGSVFAGILAAVVLEATMMPRLLVHKKAD